MNWDWKKFPFNYHKINFSNILKKQNIELTHWSDCLIRITQVRVSFPVASFTKIMRLQAKKMQRVSLPPQGLSSHVWHMLKINKFLKKDGKSPHTADIFKLLNIFLILYHYLLNLAYFFKEPCLINSHTIDSLYTNNPKTRKSSPKLFHR